MTPRSVQPQPCTDTDCKGQHKPRERIALAASLCSSRGVQLTKLRRQILELVWESGRSTGAYELIEALKRRDSRPVAPPTVYRALEFLMSQGLVSKIESLNAYVPCAHPERRQDCLFFVCDICKAAVEMEDRKIARQLSKDAAALGFRTEHQIVEIKGTCAGCITNVTP